MQDRRLLLNRKRLTKTVRGLGQTSVVDPLTKRFRYILAFLVAAVIVAAALRHGFHVYGGFSREEIREDALLALGLVVLAVIILRRARGKI